MKILSRLLLLALLVGGCATRPPIDRGDPLDQLARDYVQLALEIGEHDQDYVDAFHGPAEWREAARAAPRDVPSLTRAATELQARAAAISLAAGSIEARRHAFLSAQIHSAYTRLRMLAGERLSFVEEAEGLYGIRPDIRPLTDFDPVLARIDRLLPGDGPLAARVEAFREDFIVPRDRLEPVMRAAIDECRRRTLAHIDLPEGERFTLELVTDKSWSGYNWYQGHYVSLIQVNVDLPFQLNRAVDLGCHEGYPGHHAHNVLLEQRLARGRGWVEYFVHPLFSPHSFIAEGVASYGGELAFPPADRLAYETHALYPLAGLDASGASRYLELEQAMQDLAGARFTIARDYLDGRIDRAQAVELTRRYQLVSPARAEQLIAFTDHYRAYVINYGLGRELVARHVEAAGPGQAERWAVMERLLTEPVIPADLLPMRPAG